MPCKVRASQFDLCKLSTAAYILREIWVSRCRARFDGKEMKARQICLSIITKVQLHSFAVTPLSRSTFTQHIALEILGIAKTRVRCKAGNWFRWERPPNGFVKLNVDGSARHQAIAEGGILRNHHGVLVAAFASSYGQGTNNHAEFYALLEGLRLCRELHLANVIIESDSNIVVSAMRNKHVDNWNLTYILRQCLQLMGKEY